MNQFRKKRGNAWIDIVLSVLIITLITAGSYLLFFSPKNKAATHTDNEKPSTIIDTIESKYPGIKISTETSNDLFTPYAIQYPESLHSSFNEEIATYINDVKKTYIKEMKTYKESGGKLEGELNISFQTIPHHSGNYSFVLLTNKYTSGANGTTEIRTFHLHPETGNRIEIQNLFNNDTTNLELVSQIVLEKLHANKEIKEFLIPEGVTSYTKPTWENFNDFALSNQALIFYFDKYTVATGAAGTPIITIPLEKLDGIISDAFKGEKTKVDAQRNENSSNSKNEGQQEETKENLAIQETTPPNSSIKKVALTFDDGPHPKVTRQILDILKKYDAKATFFMLGSRVEYYPDIANEVKEAGHELGNHSWTHLDLSKASDERIQNEINNTSTIIEQATGKKVTVFRPPYGAFNDNVRAQTKLPIILWDVDTLDWKYRDANKLLPIIKSDVKDGSNILMHDIHQSTADGLDSVLAFLKSEGYTFVTVSELANNIDK